MKNEIEHTLYLAYQPSNHNSAHSPGLVLLPCMVFSHFLWATVVAATAAAYPAKDQVMPVVLYYK